MKTLISVLMMAIAVLTLAIAPPGFAADLQQGAQVFSANCAACHVGGGNVVMSNKTLSQEDLEAYGMNSIEAIVNQATYGKNAMPAFQGRVTPEQLQDVAAYILDQAEKGW